LSNCSFSFNILKTNKKGEGFDTLGMDGTRCHSHSRAVRWADRLDPERFFPKSRDAIAIATGAAGSASRETYR